MADAAVDCAQQLAYVAVEAAVSHGVAPLAARHQMRLVYNVKCTKGAVQCARCTAAAVSLLVTV